MSVVSLSSGEPTCTVEDLKAIACANNFSIEPGSANESAFLLFANSFDAICDTINGLPEFEDPRVAPCPVQGGERTYYRPEDQENALNAWAHKTVLKSADPSVSNGVLAGRTIAIKDNMSVAGLPLGLGTSESLLAGGRSDRSQATACVTF